MPPKANKRPPIRRPANRLINQQTIELPTTKTNKDISAGVNSFFDIIKKDILIVSGGATVSELKQYIDDIDVIVSTSDVDQFLTDSILENKSLNIFLKNLKKFLSFFLVLRIL